MFQENLHYLCMNIATDLSAEVDSSNKKRWHLAFATIYCSRAFKNKDSTKVTPVLVSSYNHGAAYNPRKVRVSTETIAIDVVQQHPLFSGIDQSSLAKIVKDKSVEKLADLGGVQGVAASLKSDATNGISGDPEDVARRHEAFGSNTYLLAATDTPNREDPGAPVYLSDETSLIFKQESIPDKSILIPYGFTGNNLIMEGTTSQNMDSNEMENIRVTLEAMTQAFERLSTEAGAIRGEVTTISGRLEQVESQRNSRPSTPRHVSSNGHDRNSSATVTPETWPQLPNPSLASLNAASQTAYNSLN
ncbi:hypothetical protein FXO38_08234 [Capsicum annuum]|nr:hypothetical protein FXO38_08234 [Capsicum annuum]